MRPHYLFQCSVEIEALAPGFALNSTSINAVIHRQCVAWGPLDRGHLQLPRISLAAFLQSYTEVALPTFRYRQVFQKPIFPIAACFCFMNFRAHSVNEFLNDDLDMVIVLLSSRIFGMRAPDYV